MSTQQASWPQRLDTVKKYLLLLWQNFQQDGCRESAAALTYTTLFAIVPVMTVTLVILSSIPSINAQAGVLQEWVFDSFVPSAGSQVVDYLQEFSRQATNLTGIGIVFLVVTSVLLLRTIEGTMNRIWKVSQPRKGIFSFLMYWAILSMGPILFGAGIVMSSYVMSIQLFNDAASFLGGMATFLKILPFFFSAVAFTVIFVVVPNCYVPWRAGLVGGITAALLFELAKLGFAAFIANSPNYHAVYGAFAAVPLFLLWLYFSWVIFFVGAQVVRTQVVFREHYRGSSRLQEMLRLLYVFWQEQKKGGSIRPQRIRALLSETGTVRWDEFRNLLTDANVIHRLDDGSFALIRDLEQMTLSELLDQMPWSARDQLQVEPDYWQGWERELKKRCDQALKGMRSPLDISPAALFVFPPDSLENRVEQMGENRDHG